MKKLVLVLAVAFSATLFSCGGDKKADNKACNDTCKKDATEVAAQDTTKKDSANVKANEAKVEKADSAKEVKDTVKK